MKQLGVDGKSCLGLKVGSRTDCIPLGIFFLACHYNLTHYLVGGGYISKDCCACLSIYRVNVVVILIIQCSDSFSTNDNETMEAQASKRS
jgi:hypothetical protein